MMRPRLAFLVATALIVTLIVARAQSQAPAAQNTFRTGIDLIQLDVSVLDKDRRPVRDLTQSDFTLLIDGKPQPVAAFAAVDLPDRLVSSAALGTASWLRNTAPDVVANDLPQEGRIVVIMMDATIEPGPTTTTARRIATAAIDGLGPGDLAAVLYVQKGRPQNLTSDRARLLEAISSPDPGWEISDEAKAITGFGGVEKEQGFCYCGLCVLDTLNEVATQLRDIPRRRKSLLFIGSKVSLESGDPDCGPRLKEARERALRAADIANVTVHAFDPKGLDTVSPVGRASTPNSTGRGFSIAAADRAARTGNLSNQDSLRSLARYTGGRAVLNTNTPDALVSEVLRESDSYYLVGFQPSPDVRTKSDGSPLTHTIEIKVNRRDVTVRSRRAYELAPPDARRTHSLPSGVSATPVDVALAEAIPQGSVPLALSAVPLISDTRTSSVALILRIADANRFGGRPITIQAGAYDRHGKVEASARQIASLESVGSSTASAPRPPAFEVFARLDLDPGLHEVRMAAGTTADDASSVRTYVEVPDVRKQTLAVSGLVLNVAPSVPAGSDEMLASLLPFVPTAQRNFVRTDVVTVFARISHGGGGDLRQTGVRTEVVDTSDRVVWADASQLTSDQFGPGRVANHQLRLPLDALAPGRYLLRVTATVPGVPPAMSSAIFTMGSGGLSWPEPV